MIAIDCYGKPISSPNLHNDPDKVGRFQFTGSHLTTVTDTAIVADDVGVTDFHYLKLDRPQLHSKVRVVRAVYP